MDIIERIKNVDASLQRLRKRLENPDVEYEYDFLLKHVSEIQIMLLALEDELCEMEDLDKTDPLIE